LYNSQHMTMGRNWCTTSVLNKPNHMKFNLVWHYSFLAFFIFCFVKALRWWGVTRSTQPHVHTYMFCPHVISTLYQLLEEYKWELSKDTFLMHSSHNFTPKRNELRYHWCLSQLYFIGH
jgi:hypothetical protein